MTHQIPWFKIGLGRNSVRFRWRHHPNTGDLAKIYKCSKLINWNRLDCSTKYCINTKSNMIIHESWRIIIWHSRMRFSRTSSILQMAKTIGSILDRPHSTYHLPQPLFANHGKLIQKLFWNFHFPGRHTGGFTGKLIR